VASDDKGGGQKEGKGEEKSGKRGTKKVAQHRHCMICHRVIPLSQDTCKGDCELEFIKKRQLSEQGRTVMYVLMTVAVFLLVLQFI
jgi:predicted nucleic acid-binding Zn ribbon protein